MALSAERRGSRNDGKYVLLQSFGIADRHGADAGVPLARAIAVALVRSLRRPLAVGRTWEAFDLDVTMRAATKASISLAGRLDRSPSQAAPSLPLCRWSWDSVPVCLSGPEPDDSELAHDLDFAGAAVDDLGIGDFAALLSSLPATGSFRATPPPAPPTPRPGTQRSRLPRPSVSCRLAGYASAVARLSREMCSTDGVSALMVSICPYSTGSSRSRMMSDQTAPLQAPWICVPSLIARQERPIRFPARGGPSGNRWPHAACRLPAQSNPLLPR